MQRQEKKGSTCSDKKRKEAQRQEKKGSAHSDKKRRHSDKKEGTATRKKVQGQAQEIGGGPSRIPSCPVYVF